MGLVQIIYSRILITLEKVGLLNTLHYINGAQTLPAPLNKEEEKIAFQKLETDPQKARETLIVHNLRLVVYIAKKFESTGIYVEDLVSIGTIGLIKAVNTFSPAKNIKLATYASRCIENEILMYLRKNTQSRNDNSVAQRHLYRRAAEYRLGRQRTASVRYFGDGQRFGK